jgi:uncharacterized membrane protein YedE/YeeE
LNSNFLVLEPLIGGIAIGLAAVLLLHFNGRIAGISGIVDQAFSGSGGRQWRMAFLAGLAAGGALLLPLVDVSVLRAEVPVPAGAIALGGILVGVGTRLGTGCTSGHGVCGIGRLSPRSIVATITFISTGALVVAAIH